MNCFVNILNFINEFLPIKTKTIHTNNKTKKWFNQDLKKLREKVRFTQLANKNPHFDCIDSLKMFTRNYSPWLK